MLGQYMMWFAVGVSGLGAFGTAAAFAWRPTEDKLMLMRPLSLASVFSAIGSLTAGMATILQGAAATATWSPHGVSRLLMGSAEALIPMFAAFSFLAVAWLLVAVGMRRAAYAEMTELLADATETSPPS